jgi:hypothetical protein
MDSGLVLRTPRNDEASVANSARRANQQNRSSHGLKDILLYGIAKSGDNSPSSAQLEGRFAIVTIRRAWDAMDAVGVRCFGIGRNARSVRRSRVVLAPRPWRYVGGKYPAGNGGKKGRFPGESTKEIVTPSRGESRDVLAAPVAKPVCVLSALFCTRDCGRSRRLAFPASSVQEGANEFAKLRRDRAVRMRACIYRFGKLNCRPGQASQRVARMRAR